MTRIKAPSLRSKSEFIELADELARKTLALKKLELRRDAKIQAIQTESEAEIRELTDDIKVGTLLCEKYAESHGGELFSGELKTAESGCSTFGYRMGNPTLERLRRWTWDEVIKALHEQGLSQFVIKTEKVDKNGMKAHLSDEQLRSVGTQVTQTDEFFIKPKAESLETITA